MATRPIRVWSGTAWEDVAIAPYDSTVYLSSATASATYATQTAYSSLGRNLIINGAMQVAQRGTSVASITGDGYYTADRWYFQTNNQGTFTMSVENDAPTGSGFRKSAKLLCTTADASPAAGDFIRFRQPLEGQELQRIKKGTASAEQLTLSFWVKSNVTGTYIVTLEDADNTRHVAASYSVSASATWERKTITFPADTTGAFDNDNAVSLSIVWWLGAGTNRTSGTLATTWASDVTANSAVGQTNLAAAANNYWQITGVQLETGIATPFEFEPYETTLRKCQRYYYRVEPGSSGRILGSGQAYSTTATICMIPFKTPMRTRPTALEQSGTASHYAVLSGTATVTALNAVPTYSNNTTNEVGIIEGVVASGLTAGNATYVLANNATSYLAWSAEL